MASINIYLSDPATKAKAEKLVKQRGLSSVSELFAKLVEAEAKRKRGVGSGKAVVS